MIKNEMRTNNTVREKLDGNEKASTFVNHYHSSHHEDLQQEAPSSVTDPQEFFMIQHQT